MSTRKYEETSLFAEENYNTMAPSVTECKPAILDMSIDEMIHNIDIAIRLKSENTFKKTCNEIVQALKYKEIKILYNHYFDTVNRNLVYTGFHRAKTAAGKCVEYRKRLDAEITLNKNICLEDNGKYILDVLAHEVLHGILPFNEGHGKLFKACMNVLNKEMNINIVTRGFFGKIKSDYKYEIYCPKCGRVFWRYYRKCMNVDYPEFYKCRQCQENLKSRKIQ